MAINNAADRRAFERRFFLAVAILFPIVVLIGFAPSMRRLVPKPGAWMLTLRQFLVFPLLGSAAWLTWVVGRQAGVDVRAFLVEHLGRLPLDDCLQEIQRPHIGHGAVFDLQNLNPRDDRVGSGFVAQVVQHAILGPDQQRIDLPRRTAEYLVGKHLEHSDVAIRLVLVA